MSKAQTKKELAEAGRRKVHDILTSHAAIFPRVTRHHNTFKVQEQDVP